MKTMEQDNLLGVETMNFPVMEFPNMDFNMMNVDNSQKEEEPTEDLNGLETYN